MHMGRGQPPFRLRLWASPGTGNASQIAALTTWGSIVAALALLAFAAGAARGITAQHHAAALDEERARLEVVSATGAGLAHRIRNPLATIKATAQLLASQSDGAMHDRAQRIVESSVRIESIVDDLLRFARPVEVHAEDIDLADAARAVADRIDADGTVRVHADREHVTSAIEELVANARAFDSRDPEVAVSRRGRHGIVEVRDRGPGLQIDAAHAFEPYVTTRANGTGLGLPAIRALIRANHGDVTLANREGGGCVATITLPAVSG
jgi:signal transduction histidine kinase